MADQAVESQTIVAEAGKTDAPKTETVPAATPEPKAAPEPKSTAFVQAARHQKEMQKLRDEVTQLRQAQTGRLTEDEFRKMAQEHPEKYIDYNAYTMRMKNGGKPGPDERIARLESELQTRDRQAKEREEQQEKESHTRAEQERQQREVEYQDEVKGFLATNQDKYQLTTALDAWGAVYNEIRNAYTTRGVVMTEAEAADIVEKRLEDASEKALTVPRMKSRWQRLEQAATAPEVAKGTTPPVSKTLAGTGATTPQTGKPKTKAERNAEFARIVAETRKARGE